MKPEELKIGEKYYYWSKSIYEKHPTKKLCKLEWFNSKYARVSRFDLDKNQIQTVNISRLLPITVSERAKAEGVNL